MPTRPRSANRITPEQLEAIAGQLYAELLAGGYTEVCDFHYLHNDVSGAAYADPAEIGQPHHARAAGGDCRPALRRTAGRRLHRGLRLSLPAQRRERRGLCRPGRDRPTASRPSSWRRLPASSTPNCWPAATPRFATFTTCTTT